MNKEHMQVLVRANKEMEHPERFTMETYVHNEWMCTRGDSPMEWCGTPACLLGNFGARSDLQPLLTVLDDDLYWQEPTDKDADPLSCVKYTDDRLLQYFDITEDEASRLFAPGGCGGAKTRDEALAYVERFIAKHE